METEECKLCIPAVVTERDRLRTLNAKLLEACKGMDRLYGHMCLGPLDSAALYGPDYRLPTDEDCRIVKAKVEAAIVAAAEEAKR